MNILGARLRPIAAGIYVGTTAEHDVHVSHGPRGWRVCAVEPLTGAMLGFGIGETIDEAARRADIAMSARQRAA